MNSLIWQTSPSSTTPPELADLAQTQSLTRALKQLDKRFSVQLDYLGLSQIFPFFKDLSLPETLFVRNVHLLLNNIAVVAAQSVCLPNSKWCEILNCGTHSLGSILFSDSLDVQRSGLFFCMQQGKLVRRSWFDYQGERLYLVECFLPDLLPFLNVVSGSLKE